MTPCTPIIKSIEILYEMQVLALQVHFPRAEAERLAANLRATDYEWLSATAQSPNLSAQGMQEES